MPYRYYDSNTLLQSTHLKGSKVELPLRNEGHNAATCRTHQRKMTHGWAALTMADIGRAVAVLREVTQRGQPFSGFILGYARDRFPLLGEFLGLA